MKVIGLDRVQPCGRWSAAVLCCALLAAGCGKTDVQFKLNRQGKEFSASELDGERQQKLVNALTAVFGTPDAPYAWPLEGEEEAARMDRQDKLHRAGGAVSKGRGLYREHCAHCHGVTGDGLGPTAAFLNPFPRDFRVGTFKFTSTDQGTKPTREDLRHTLREGIQGTAMPAFKVALANEEIDDLAEYVIYLNMRGEMEKQLIRDDEQLTPQYLSEVYNELYGFWAEAEEKVFVPPPRERPETPEALAQSIARGRELFLGAKGVNCVKCHGPQGLGDGGDVGYNTWDKEHQDLLAANPREAAQLYTLSLRKAQPRNLRSNVFRGGRRPIDIYRRLAVGIKGTPMPAQAVLGASDAGSEEAAKTKLTTEEVWNLVDYVLSLPYEPASQPRPLPPAHRSLN